jgi:hypothetical protein
MLARKLPYFNNNSLTLNIENLELEEGFRDFPIIFSKVPFIYLFYLKIFMQ